MNSFTTRWLILLGLLAGGNAAPKCLAQAAGPGSKPDYTALRARMVEEDLAGQGIQNERVLQAFRDTPRHEFVAGNQRQFAYFDMAIPIGKSQTISAPFVVAYMTEQLDPQPTDKVLEIGTGSGFQAAILSPLVKDVYTIEIVESLGQGAQRVLDRLKYKNVHTKIGDGFQGWAEHAPFDKIIVTCSPEEVPVPLVEQLKEGGLMVVPVGERYQQVLYLMQKKDGKLEQKLLRPTLFVPMTGKAENERKVLPDPAKPEIQNSSFEELAGDSQEPVAWYYARQMSVMENPQAPAGKRFIRFSNDVPGRGTRMMQGLAVDGRKVDALELSCHVQAENVVAGANKDEKACVTITFFDENRARVGYNWIGPFSGSFAWKKERLRIPVPAQAREALVHVGMFGATGTIDFDAVELRAITAQELRAEQPK
ncbi:MAG: protein-L-isoaspartate(D-aspartate) O-methyltransferase [Pirellulales bacterium]|nr:protein-L-isoaspartate(D-aspartate) O-methyltransferase [Pirellulales bacterium]